MTINHDENEKTNTPYVVHVPERIVTKDARMT